MLPSGFISVKWKVILITSVLLFALTALFVGLDQRSRLRAFEADRHAVRAQNILLARKTVGQTQEHLIRLAALIAGLPEVRRALEAGDGPALERGFAPYFDALQFSAGLVAGAFFDSRGRRVATQAESMVPANELSDLGEPVRTVLSLEDPRSHMVCDGACRIYAVVPVLAGGRSVGALALGATLEEVILGFRRSARNDLGLAVPVPRTVAGDPFALPALGMRVVALSEAKTNLDVLRRAAGSWSRGDHGVQYQEVAVTGRRFEVARWPAEVTGGSSAEFVVVSDLSEVWGSIDAARHKGIMVGAAGLAVAETALLLLLAGPMDRVRRMAEALPLIGQGEFEAVRQRLAGRRRRWHRDDELDLLDRTGIALADTLERMTRESETQRMELSRLVSALSKERDFITGLLDTAQVLIVTHDRDGHVAMVNGFALELTGRGYSELHGGDFATCFFAPEDRDPVRASLVGLRDEDAAVLKTEAALPCREGTVRQVVWFHSRLTGEADAPPATLSVGLDITDLRRAEEAVHRLSEFDALTGLMNRNRFQDALSGVLAEPEVTGALMVLDIDDFKSVNDTGGHEAGDAVLMAVAQRLRDLPEAPVLTARLGGDDFACVFPGVDAARAMMLGKQVTGAFADISAIGGGHAVSVSVGVALFPDHGGTSQELLSSADLALFRAKEKGRGGWHLYAADDRLLERVISRLYWVDRIEHALADDRFELYFQPVVRLADNVVTHYEALIRMRGSDNEIIAPGEFIAVAEATGLIRAIDRWVLKRAVATLAEWGRRGIDARLAMNLSGRSFADPSVPETLRQALAEQGVDGERLIIEITETATLEDIGAARTLAENLMALGCTIALDDFGVGFASFQYLKELPVGVVKIDGSFIRHLDTSADDQVFVRALVASARAFGKETVAEFVENAAILAILREIGVDYAQGYYLGRPVPQIAQSVPMLVAAGGA